jgi:hypothetical protein
MDKELAVSEGETDDHDNEMYPRREGIKLLTPLSWVEELRLQ